MGPVLQLLLVPFLACLVLTAIHAYLGIHILARGVIFVDLALAQIAALGATLAFLAGHPLQSPAAYWYALVFTMVGAAVFALTRPQTERVPHEAIIGIAYVGSAAAAVLVIDRAPQGAEYIKTLMLGNILTVADADVAKTAGLYLGVAVLHWLLRRRFLLISFEPQAAARRGLWIRAWDFVFYMTFGVVVTSSVRMAGVLLVFTYLIIPAAAGVLLADRVLPRLVIGWALGIVASAAGLGASYAWDLPTGATLVCTFVLALVLITGARGLARPGAIRPAALRRAGRALLATGGAGLALAGLFLAAAPEADHWWLDLLEDRVPAVRLAFLRPRERGDFREARHGAAALAGQMRTLRQMQADAGWGDRSLSAEMQFRIEQSLLSNQEMLGGERFVLRELRRRARQRQRFVLGLPVSLTGLILLGIGLAWPRWRRRSLPGAVATPKKTG